MTPVQKLTAMVAALVVIIGGLYYYSTHPQTASPSTSTTATTTPSATSTPGANLTLVTPDYHKPIAFSADISPDIRSQLNMELAVVQSDLTKNPLNIKDWVDLGTLHKMGGDYTNAALYWEYIASSYSGTGVPYLSLGNLYEDYLHDLTKAEGYYKDAIKVDAHNVNAYADLYTMYHYTLHNDAKASAILQQGLSANPGNNYLLGLKSELSSTTPQ